MNDRQIRRLETENQHLKRVVWCLLVAQGGSSLIPPNQLEAVPSEPEFILTRHFDGVCEVEIVR